MKSHLFRKFFLTLAAVTGFTNIAAAALPDKIPTNRADAQIYALSHAVRVDRFAKAEPVGSLRLLDINYREIPAMDRFTVPQPSNADRVLATIAADKFKFVLPKKDSRMILTYDVFDSFGNRTLTSWSQVTALPTGNPAAPWKYSSNEVYLVLDGDFELEIDANFISIEFYNKETGETERHFLMPKIVGDKKFFTIPTYWFDDPRYQAGVTYVYGEEEFRQYDNASGNIAGIDPISFAPSGNVSNHFFLYDSTGAVVPEFVTVQSWSNALENPSFEYHAGGPAGALKTLNFNVRTSEGVNAIGIRVSEQDENGKVTTYDQSLQSTPNYGVGSVTVKGGRTYFFRMFWPDYIVDRMQRG